MRIAVWNKGEDVDLPSRGEERWNLNWVNFLKQEGHDVIHATPPLRYKSDLFLDAPDDCAYLANKKHVHLKFGPCLEEIKEFACYKNGQTLLATPYRKGYEAGQKHWGNDHRVQMLLLPMCYPDSYLPKKLQPGFSRKEITWACKEPFVEAYATNPGMRHVCDNAIYSLRALEKLSASADFKFNLLLAHQLRDGFAPYREEAERIVRKLTDKEEHGNLPWTQIVEKMSKSKLALCPGGIPGSVLECIFAKGLPIQQEGAFLEPPREITLLPVAGETKEEDWYPALEKFWFDRAHYRKAWEWYQDCFIDHRTDGLRKAWKEAMEIIGV